MFTERSKVSLENLLESALETGIGETVECKSITDKEQIEKDHVIVLTITTYSLRVLILLFYNEDNELKNYIADKTKSNISAVDKVKFNDFMQEIGNSVCGSMKRELGGAFPHLGMSTPYILELSSLKYLERLRFEHDVYKKVTCSHGAEIFGGIAASAEGEVDFSIAKNSSSEGDVDLGELELF